MAQRRTLIQTFNLKSFAPFDHSVAIKDFRGSWKNTSKAAGVVGRIPHDLRRTAVRNLDRAGVARSAAMKMTGHRTEAVYRRYAITEAAMLREAAVKLAVLHAAETSREKRKSPQKSAPQMTSHNDLPFKNSTISRMFFRRREWRNGRRAGLGLIPPPGTLSPPVR